MKYHNIRITDFQICLLSVLFYLLDEILTINHVSYPVLDFDEQTADDWDVDMSVYYDKGT